MKKWFISSALTLGLLASLPLAASANSYTIVKGDTLWSIGERYSVSVLDLQKTNDIEGSLIYPGQVLTLPTAVSAEERDLLSRLVHAEAKGEPYEGKVAVATVVLNRVNSSQFPNTIKEVINQSNAFTPVQNGSINKPADQEAKKAVDEAITFGGQGNGSLFFYNPDTATSDWIFSREVITKIGNHNFAK
ncbi:cell wall hydrolase [Mangrovibacillus cuniculi]|uniref:LysM peptidoglycan-binding domain-containing protein n=1 Tax=Mangrovibacillus cuniculi TaxID=2593652 RepID=A0A7S8CAN9_9BACI|nr:cell wall hydrolase [Mangrovibacillus cuniculi]QPC46494.1 LysM peptidoglycan-binding domain-containing protein [Mangrovibacillus cuniculi]